MEAPEILDIARDALFTLIKISLPIMMISLSVGLFISLIQALTQIQEMTLAFVPKIMAIFLSLMLFAPFIIEQMQGFHERMAERMIDLE